MRSTASSLALVNVSLGNFLSGVLVSIVETQTNWLPDDLNQGHLDLYFFLLAILMFVNFCGFSLVALRYKYRQVEHAQHQPHLFEASDEDDGGKPPRLS